MAFDSVHGVHIPQWLQAYATEIAADRRVESVVLFGSRANGRAHAESDWDVAVLHTENVRNWPQLNVDESIIEGHDVQNVLISQDRYTSHRNAIGSIGYEIAHNGVFLAGKIPLQPLPAEHDMIDTTELAGHMGLTFTFLADAIFKILQKHPAISSVDRQFADHPSRLSGDAAEFLAKALCVYCETGYDKTHDLEHLAQRLPEEWRDVVLSMNGGNTARHVQHYDFVGTSESTSDVVTRVNTIFDLLQQFAPLILAKLPHEKQTWLLAEIRVAATVLDAGRVLLRRLQSGDYPDATFETWRGLVARYEQQVDSISNYISQNRDRGES